MPGKRHPRLPRHQAVQDVFISARQRHSSASVYFPGRYLLWSIGSSNPSESATNHA